MNYDIASRTNNDVDELHLYSGHTLSPLLSLWAVVDVTRSTNSFRKWKSFSDSMHCFLLHGKTDQHWELIIF